MNTATNSDSKTSKPRRQRRKASGERKKRHYYARSQDGKTLFQFKYYDTRTNAIEGESLISLNAGEFRQLWLESSPPPEVIQREEEPPVKAVVADTKQSESTESAASVNGTTASISKDEIALLGEQIAKSMMAPLTEFLGKFAQTRASGGSANAERPTPNH